MDEFVSGMAADITAMLDYREALGYSRKSQGAILKSFDRFCANCFDGFDVLTKEMVFAWLEEQHSGMPAKAAALRALGHYMKATGKDAYVLYNGYMKDVKKHPAYVFSDREVTALFAAIDKTRPTHKEPFLHEIAPVLYRLIYTCGLRPNEGRELKCEHVDLKTGEILITNTKWKKERLVVMSKDMLRMCNLYDRSRSVFARGNDYFFPSWEGGGPFSAVQLGSYFRDAWKRANPKTASSQLPLVRVYDLRHRFASAALIRWLDSGQSLGAKLPYLRTYMGHNSLSETAYYIHLLPENLVKSAGIDWAAFDEMIPEAVAWRE